LEALAKANGGLPIYFVLDNARYQRCEVVAQAAARMGINLVFLPPYSPDLNLIERLWKFMRKNILHAKYYDCADKFHRAVRDGLERIGSCPVWGKELASLLAPNFQTF
jgi:transposase